MKRFLLIILVVLTSGTMKLSAQIHVCVGDDCIITNNYSGTGKADWYYWGYAGGWPAELPYSFNGTQTTGYRNIGGNSYQIIESVAGCTNPRYLQLTSLNTVGTYVINMGVHRCTTGCGTGVCADITNASVTIIVDPITVGGSINHGSETICLGEAITQLNVSGYTGSIIKWQKKLNAAVYTDIANTTTHLDDTPASSGIWMYRAVIQSGACDVAYSSTCTITVNPASVGGSITGGTSSICSGNATGLMTLSGHSGTVVNWQKRINSGSWTNIPGTSNQTIYSDPSPSVGT